MLAPENISRRTALDIAGIDHPAVDVAVVGSGPAGLATALSLAIRMPALRIAAIGPRARTSGPSKPADTRTVALFGPSLALLGRLGVLADLEQACAAITAIRLIDDNGGLLRAPEALFSAAEAGHSRFGLNVPNSLLVDVLENAVTAAPSITRIEGGDVARVSLNGSHADLALNDGTHLTARLAVAADGRASITREAAGIGVRTWDYEQVALVTRFEHARPHDGISTELHRPGGPCTTVPLPGNASSLVWVERPAIARRLAGLDDAAFRAALMGTLQGMLGEIGTLAPRRAIPLTGLVPDRFGAARVALVGEAAHVFPPIGAQGLNLGLRDAASLADAVAEHGAGDAGGQAALAAYDRDRRLDVGSRVLGVDLLGRSLTSPNPLFGIARGVGMHLAHAVPALRRAMIGAGLAPVGKLPRLMQP